MFWLLWPDSLSLQKGELYNKYQKPTDTSIQQDHSVLTIIWGDKDTKIQLCVDMQKNP